MLFVRPLFIAFLVRQRKLGLSSPSNGLDSLSGEATSSEDRAPTVTDDIMRDVLQARDEIAKETEVGDIVDDLRDSLRHVDGEMALQRSNYEAETNIRPYLIMRVYDWYLQNNSEHEKVHSTTQAFQAFAKKERERMQRCYDKAVELGHLFLKSSTIPAERLEEKVADLCFNVVSDPAVNHDEEISMDITGFVVNTDEDLETSSLLSAALMFFDTPHTVMSDGYTKVRYTWSPNEKED